MGDDQMGNLKLYGYSLRDWRVCSELSTVSVVIVRTFSSSPVTTFSPVIVTVVSIVPSISSSSFSLVPLSVPVVGPVTIVLG